MATITWRGSSVFRTDDGRAFPYPSARAAEVAHAMRYRAHELGGRAEYNSDERMVAAEAICLLEWLVGAARERRDEWVRLARVAMQEDGGSSR